MTQKQGGWEAEMSGWPKTIGMWCKNGWVSKTDEDAVKKWVGGKKRWWCGAEMGQC